MEIMENTFYDAVMKDARGEITTDDGEERRRLPVISGTEPDEIFMEEGPIFSGDEEEEKHRRLGSLGRCGITQDVCINLMGCFMCDQFCGYECASSARRNLRSLSEQTIIEQYRAMSEIERTEFKDGVAAKLCEIAKTNIDASVEFIQHCRTELKCKFVIFA